MRHDLQGRGGFDEAIPDMAAYDQAMRKSLLDKVYFLDKVDSTLLVDYGCADGATIAFMRAIFPEKTYVGFDIGEEHLARAREAVPGVVFTSDWDEVLSIVRERREARPAVVCNSLIHEVYSYGNPEQIEDFWTRILDTSTFRYVVMRDMCVSRTASRQSDPLSVIKIRQRYDQARLNEFEAHWGSLSENWSALHFLLKHRYHANWSREVRENYLPINLEDLLARIPAEWTPRFFEHFTLPFVREDVERTFGIQIQDRTHVKLILEAAG